MKTIDHIPLTFGKYVGLSPTDLMDVDPSYIIWMYNNINPKPCSKILFQQATDAIADEDLQWDLKIHKHLDNDI